MNQRIAVAAAVLSSALGGMAAAATRYVIEATDPITLAALRFGFLFLLPLSLALERRWPGRKDWIGVAALGLLFFAIFFVLYNVALSWTTAARGSLALATLPVVTMLVGALLGVEAPTARKLLGVLIAVAGVGIALAAGLAQAPSRAWRGDLVMAAATCCMALYSIWSRPYIERSSPLTFLTCGMGVGAALLAIVAGLGGGLQVVAGFAGPQWLAILYLGACGAALNFYLWVFALQHASPTRVTNTITVSPISSALLAAVLVDEPIGLDLIVGLVAVLAGIWLATTEPRAATRRA
jgi:drug/metabolite transporter (DMT)-like permease